jgi:hypothetical protein
LSASALLSPCDFSPHLRRRLVLAQPDVNRVPQEVVSRPGQIGDLGDQLRLGPVDYRDAAPFTGRAHDYDLVTRA